jgi:hypothetical protein
MVENQLAGYMFVASAGGVNEKFSGSMLFCNPTTSKPLFSSQNILQNILDFRHIESLDTCMKH